MYSKFFQTVLESFKFLKNDTENFYHIGNGQNPKQYDSQGLVDYIVSSMKPNVIGGGYDIKWYPSCGYGIEIISMHP